jgi:hypothetical protein
VTLAIALTEPAVPQSLGIPTPQVLDYYNLRMAKYKFHSDSLRALVDSNPDTVESTKSIDNALQDLLLMLMEDNILTTQVRMDKWYTSISGQTAAFRDFLESHRFLILGLRKNYANSW